MKSDSTAPKVSPPKVSSPRVDKTRVGNPQGRTNKMLDNLLDSVGLQRDEGGSA